jgi:hypothetical protein
MLSPTPSPADSVSKALGASLLVVVAQMQDSPRGSPPYFASAAVLLRPFYLVPRGTRYRVIDEASGGDLREVCGVGLLALLILTRDDIAGAAKFS